MKGIEICKEGKKIKDCILRRIKQRNKQFERKANRDEQGNGKLIWKYKSLRK